MKPLPVCDNTGDKITPGVDGLTAYDQTACSVKSRIDQIAGFTLVEVTLALGVVTICLIALMGLLPTSLKTQQSSIPQTTANQIISQISSFLRADVRLPPGQSITGCTWRLTDLSAK